MSLYILTVKTNSYPSGVDWIFDVEAEYIKSVELVEKLQLQATSVEESITDFNEFHDWLKGQVPRDDA